ncbi:MAG: hypothetical protein ABIF77_20890 [bacterium]
MAKLENKNINPILAAIANFCCLGGLGYILIGQTKKAIIFIITALIVSIVASFGYTVFILPGLALGLVYFLLVVFTALDIHALATAIAKGEQVDEHEYRFEILFRLVKPVHAEAVFNAGGSMPSAAAEVKVEEPAAPEPESAPETEPTPEPEQEPEGEDDKKE